MAGTSENGWVAGYFERRLNADVRHAFVVDLHDLVVVLVVGVFVHLADSEKEGIPATHTRVGVAAS